MAVKGKALRKDLVEDGVFAIGRDFAKSLEPGIKSTKDWISAMNDLKKAALEYAEIEKQFKVSEGRKEFLKIKQEEEKLRKATAASLKAEQEAIIAIEKSKQALLTTEKKKNDNDAKILKLQKAKIKLSEQERLEQRLLNRGAREAAVISSKLSTEYEKQSVILTRLRRKYKDVALTEGEASTKALKLQQRIQKLDATLKRVDANVGQFQRSVGNYGKAMTAAGNAARSLASAMGLVGGAFLVVQVIRDAIGVVRAFEKQNATLSAILQVEREDMQGLTQDAIRLGESTVKTANQVTELQIAYARLGFSQGEILNLTEATISGSIAMNAELDKTANLVGAVINTFDDLKTTDADKVIDILSLATAKSALNFQKLETGIPIVAGAAEAANIPFTTLVALMGKLSDSGIDVSTSSTSLRNIFIESAAQGLKYSEIVQKIKDSQDKLTAANDEFGKRAAVSATVLAKNIDTTLELDEALQGAAGTAERMANKELDTLDGALKLLRSAWEGFILGINDSSGSSNTLKETINALASNLKQIFRTIGFVAKAYVGYVVVARLARLQTSLMSKQFTITRVTALASARGINVAALAFAKFNKILKANALGLAITAIAGIIYIFQKYNKTLEESIKKTNESTESYLESRQEQAKVSISLKEMSDRYEVLSNKTELNKEEQEELDSIVNKIAKTVPKAVVEIDKYGNALKLNTKEVEKFNTANEILNNQQEEVLLKENTRQLELLRRKQEELNKITEEGQSFYVKGVGLVANYNGKLKEQIQLGSKAGTTTLAGNELTSEQIALVQKTIEENENNISAKEKFIESLTAEGRAAIKARLEAEKLAKSNKQQAEEAEVLASKKAEEILKVSDLKDKIKELKTEQDGLTKNDKNRAIEIVELIKIYQDEINAILGVSTANKSAEKAEKERLTRIKKLAEDASKLRKFHLNKQVSEQDSVFNNESKAFSKREIALQERTRLELELALETSKSKFDTSKEFSDKEIEILLNRGESSKETLQKITDEELLIIEKFQSEKEAILNREEEGQDSLEVSKIKASATKAQIEIEKKINTEIELENKAFLAKEGIYADELKAVELREQRISDIKKKYAIEGLNAQLAALEVLVEQSEEGSAARIEAERKVQEAKNKIFELSNEQSSTNSSDEIDREKEKAQQILEISAELSNALGDLANAIFDSKIQKIDDEIRKNDEKFEKLLEQEGLSAEERKQIEDQQERSRQELEKKKRKEQRKQAIINKAFAITDIGIKTAQAIIGIWAQVPKFDFGISAGALTAAVSALGAIQIGTVLAQKIPSYFKGTENHPGGLAEVSEYRPEVIQEPNKEPYIVNKRSILDLPKGTKVTPSIEEYVEMFRQTTLSSVLNENKKIQKHEARVMSNTYYNSDTRRLEAEVVEMRKDLRKLGERPIVFNGRVIIEEPYTEY